MGTVYTGFLVQTQLTHKVGLLYAPRSDLFIGCCLARSGGNPGSIGLELPMTMFWQKVWQLIMLLQDDLREQNSLLIQDFRIPKRVLLWYENQESSSLIDKLINQPTNWQYCRVHLRSAEQGEVTWDVNFSTNISSMLLLSCIQIFQTCI